MRERDARRRAVSPELLIKTKLGTQESNALLEWWLTATNRKTI